MSPSESPVISSNYQDNYSSQYLSSTNKPFRFGSIPTQNLSLDFSSNFPNQFTFPLIIFDASVIPLYSTACSKSTWFLNTSASHHLTSNQTILINSMTCTGFEMVMLGNDRPFSMANICDNLLPTRSKPLNRSMYFLCLL